MSLTEPKSPMHLPASLDAQLHDFRRRVWTIKILEAIGVAVFAVVIAYLLVFSLDRFIDTPGSLRLVAFLAALCGGAIVPWFLYRWVGNSGRWSSSPDCSRTSCRASAINCWALSNWFMTKVNKRDLPSFAKLRSSTLPTMRGIEIFANRRPSRATVCGPLRRLFLY